MNPYCITANGQPIAARLPCTIEEFLVAQGLLPRSITAIDVLNSPLCNAVLKD